MRACMVQLEKRGVLKNKFEKPFRRKKLWRMDWSDAEVTEPIGQGSKEAD